MAKLSHGADGALPPPVIYEFAPVARALLDCDQRLALLAGPQNQTIRSELDKEIASSGPSVLSLDVFDTFLLRNDKPETERYLELSRSIRERCLRKRLCKPRLSEIEFLLARLHAMAISYRTREPVEGCREGNIGQVIRIARNVLGLEPAVESLFLQAELDYEGANLSLNPVLVDLAASFRERGGKVILVSDMYLGSEEIAAVLDRKNVRVDFDRIFSSADCVLSKRSGKIFGLIEREMGVPASGFVHIGDSWEGDVRRPREAGWRAFHFPIARAEARRRNAALSAFLQAMREEGQDLTGWAQV